MPPVCPSCDIALDPTHAPVARIRGARVVTYCSVACAEAPAGSKKPAPDAAAMPEAKLAESAPLEETGIEETEKVVALAKPKVVEPTADELVDEAVEGRRLSASLRKRVLIASGAIMAGGMAIAVVQSVSPSSPSSVSAGHLEAGTASVAIAPDAPSTQALAESPATKDDGEVPPSAEELRALSIAELEGQLKDGSPRFQRLSGMALARIKHPGAIETLSALLKSETSDLSRIDIAYGLALAGDASGRDHLVAELESRRRDVRIDASRRLVQLGDDAGRKALHQMLGVRSHRLGAASVLALLGDEKGKQVLRDTYESAKSSDENRMRAAVGLGSAGDPIARELLLEILSEGKYVVDAAGALATLGDEAAIPALQRQLMLTAMRVGAAESLVSMEVDVDVAPLASALLKSNTEGRIAAAEAILVLGK